MLAAVTLIQVYRMKYGANYEAMLNWDEQNALLRALGHNRYPDVRSIGRPIRWEFQLDYTDADEDLKEPCCGKKTTSQISRADLNFKTIAQLERYNRILYMDLEREKKAIQNWQRMKILIAILKTCGNRMEKIEPIIAKKE